MSGKRKTSARAGRTPERTSRAAPANSHAARPTPRVSAATKPKEASLPSSQPRVRRTGIAVLLGCLVLLGIALGVRGVLSRGTTANLEKQSVEELERLALRSPSDPKILIHYATALLNKGAANDAAGVFQRVVQLDTGNAQAQLGLGRSLSRLGDLGGAEVAFKKAAELEPRNYQAHYELMQLYHENGELQSAKRAIVTALEIRPSEVNGWVARGQLHGLLREEAEAARAFEKVVVLAPNSANAWRSLGRVYWHMDRLGEAEGALKRALALKPNDPHTLWWLGQLYLKLPDSPANRSRASEVLQLATSAGQRPLPEAHVELARLYMRNDQPRLAEQSLRRALQLSPDLEVAHLELGRLLTQLSRKAEGQTHLGRYEAIHGRRRKIQTLERSLHTNPRQAAALLELARLYREFGNLTAAMRTYRRYLLERPEDQTVVDEMVAFRREVLPQPSSTSTAEASSSNVFPEHDH